MAVALADQILPVPRPHQKVGALGVALARASKGVAEVVGQIDPYGAFWDERNLTSLGQKGPVWVALGDSTAQGIGASHPNRGWVGQLEEHLDSHGEQYRLINLSVSGAKTHDLVDIQLPRLRAIVEAFGTPALVTLSIGSNDVFRSPDLRRMHRSLGEISDALPARAVLAKVPQAPISLVARVANRMVCDAADRASCLVADINQHYRAPYRGRLAADHFHPNDRGYADWAAAFAAALGRERTQS